MYKDFDEWNQFKKKIQNHHNPTFKQREIWWCSVGINVGSEVDGKNKFFNRPVLVLRKFNSIVFYGVPLSSKIKEGNPYYLAFEFKGKVNSALISQMRLFDSRRLTHLMGKLPNPEFEAIRTAVKNML